MRSVPIELQSAGSGIAGPSRETPAWNTTSKIRGRKAAGAANFTKDEESLRLLAFVKVAQAVGLQPSDFTSEED